MTIELTRDRTCWVFISDSEEPRHLYDIVLAVHVLRNRGIPDRNILVFTDHPQTGLHCGPYKIAHQILAAMGPTMAALTGFDVAVLVITGHGTTDGIGSKQTVLTPHALLSVVRTIPGLQRGVLVLCQCFAGIFDQLDAMANPQLVLLGATRLTNSFSVPYRLNKPLKQGDGSDGLVEWSANVFMMNFFNWIEKPVDIDGDGHMTLVDAYKHAGVLSTRHLVQLKSSVYMEVRNLAGTVELLAAAVRNPAAPPPVQLHFEAATKQLQNKLEMLHLHQEPWILHAQLARDTKLAF